MQVTALQVRCEGRGGKFDERDGVEHYEGKIKDRCLARSITIHFFAETIDKQHRNLSIIINRN